MSKIAIDQIQATGSAGQVLTTNGTATYWASPAVSNGSVGTLDQVLAAGNTTTKSLTIGPLTVNGSITANGSTGTAGQTLTSNGSAIYWSSATSSLDAVLAIGNTTTKSLTVGPLTVNGFFSSSNTVSARALFVTNVATISVLSNERYYANNNQGTAGQVLTSGGSGNVYWSDPATSNGQSILVSNVVVTNTATIARLSANGSTGTAGQVLASNGTALYWTAPVTANGTLVGTLDQVLAQGNTTTKTLSVGSLNVGVPDSGNELTVEAEASFYSNVNFNSNTNFFLTSTFYATAAMRRISAGGTTGTAGQVLTSNGSGNVYWSDVSGSTGGFTNGQSISVSNVVVTNTATVSRLSANGSTGLPGQVLTSNGTAVYWTTPTAEGNGSSYALTQYVAVDALVGDGTTTTFTLSRSATLNTIQVYVDGLLSVPSTDYTVIDTSLTFGEAPLTDETIIVYHSGETANVSGLVANAYINAISYAASNTYVNETFAPIVSPTFEGSLHTPKVSANGSTGTAGQVLTSGGGLGNVYWANASSGGFTNGQSISVLDVVVSNNATINRLIANGTNGSAGQVLSSNGSSVYWSTPANTAQFATNTYVNSTFATNTYVNSTFATNTYVNSTFAPVSNPIFNNTVTYQATSMINILGDLRLNFVSGGVGQVLTSNGGTGAPYWSTPANTAQFATNTYVNSTFATNTYVNTQLSTKANLANPTFTGTVTIPTISANGSTGTAGQVLTSNGTGTYWSAASASFTNGQSISVSNIGVTGTQTATERSTAGSIDCSQGNFFTINVSSNTTFAFNNIPTGSYVLTLMVYYTGGTITWPASVRWPTGLTGTPTFDNSKWNLITLYKPGTQSNTFFGTHATNFG